jgi:general secretion pathway protein F
MSTTFHFRAVGADGKQRTGSLSAENDKAVARELRRQGLTPVYVGVNEKKNFEFKMPMLGGARRSDVLFFTQELSTLLNSGVPLDRALAITAELTERVNFRLIVLEILRVLKGGKSLADSLGTHPEYFSELYVNMVRAGEAGGSLAVIFERLSEFERSRDDLRSYIVSSMVYPSLLVLVGIASIIILLTFVVPRFATIFEDGRMKIPVPTAIMLEVSKVITAYWWIAAIVITVSAVSLRIFVQTAKGRMLWDTWRLKIPVLGDALRKAETARFARAMATLVANSVPLVQSIGISAGILNNRLISGALKEVSQGVKRGEGIATPLRKAAVFPPLAAHLLMVGEETGRLDSMFARMADIYEDDTRAAIKRFTSLFEPLVILVMGVIVGSMILSMLLAITGINEVAGQ